MADKQELLTFLDRRVFHPIRNTSNKEYNVKQREKLADVQRRTEAERTRFQGYGSSERIVAMYKDDLSSEKAKSVNAHLQDLGLPRLVDIQQEFLKLAGESV